VPGDAQDGLLAEASELLDDAIAMRRRLHQWPECGLQLPATQQAVLEALDGLPLAIRTGQALTSVAAMLDGGRPGPTVLLRGDMDALQMPEDTGLSYASRIPGVMHGCGHDAHVAMLAGAARLLSGHRGELAGRVMFMFQPGEEGHDGARIMLREGLLDPDWAGQVIHAFAIHQTPLIPSGTVATRSGTILASADTFTVTVTGRGGHGSAPHAATDPIPVACEIVLGLRSHLAAHIDPFEPAVLTVGRISAGTASNVIPETAEITGTFRTVSSSARSAVQGVVRRLVSGIAATHQAAADVTISPGPPHTVNDEAVAGCVEVVAASILGRHRVIRVRNPVMAAEDFSYILRRIPGAIAFLGTQPADIPRHDIAGNHSSRMVIDESAMAAGIALYAAVALRMLAYT
jgi:amidohydrolase